MTSSTPTPPDPGRITTPVVIQVAGGAAVRIIDPTDPLAPPEHDTGLRPRTPVRCSLYSPGHHVHVIQVRLAVATASTAFEVLGVDGHTVTVRRQGADDERTWWLHDTEAVRAALLLDEHPVLHLHGHGMARLGAIPLYPCVDGAPRACSGAGPGGAT